MLLLKIHVLDTSLNKSFQSQNFNLIEVDV